MGSVTNQTDRQAFRLEDWKNIPIFSYTNISDPYYGSNFNVLAHKTLPYVQSQKYDLFFNSQAEYITYLDGYYQRFKSQYLVSALHIQKGTQKRMCSTFHAVELYLQRIPIRLFQITDMPISQGIYALQIAFQGYQQMFPKTGYFDISPDMIGINKQGKIKIWINRNFSKNFPQFSKINHNKQQPQFIDMIIKTVQNCIDYTDSHIKFSQYYYQNHNRICFKTAKVALKQYCQKNKVVIAKLMKSILLVYRNTNQINNYQSLHTISQGQDVMKFNNKRQIHRVKPRRSFHKIDEVQPQHFVKKQSLGDINSGALHMSFIKQANNYKEQIFLQEEINTKPSLPKSHNQFVQKKHIIPPPISFHYALRNSPKTSPQNKIQKLTTQQHKLFLAPKQSKFKKIKGKSFEDQKTNINLSKPIIFQSTGGAYEIDSDIAKDLEFFNI